MADKIVSLITTGYSLFQLEKNISLFYKRQQRQQLHKTIQTPYSYGTRQRDGIMISERDTFLNAYKSSSLTFCHPKQRKLHFKTLGKKTGHATKPQKQAWFHTQYAFAMRNQKPWSTS